MDSSTRRSESPQALSPNSRQQSVSPTTATTTLSAAAAAAAAQHPLQTTEITPPPTQLEFLDLSDVGDAERNRLSSALVSPSPPPSTPPIDDGAVDSSAFVARSFVHRPPIPLSVPVRPPRVFHHHQHHPPSHYHHHTRGYSAANHSRQRPLLFRPPLGSVPFFVRPTAPLLLHLQPAAIVCAPPPILRTKLLTVGTRNARHASRSAPFAATCSSSSSSSSASVSAPARCASASAASSVASSARSRSSVASSFSSASSSSSASSTSGSASIAAGYTTTSTTERNDEPDDWAAALCSAQPLQPQPPPYPPPSYPPPQHSAHKQQQLHQQQQHQLHQQHLLLHHHQQQQLQFHQHNQHYQQHHLQRPHRLVVDAACLPFGQPPSVATGQPHGHSVASAPASRFYVNVPFIRGAPDLPYVIAEHPHHHHSHSPSSPTTSSINASTESLLRINYTQFVTEAMTPHTNTAPQLTTGGQQQQHLTAGAVAAASTQQPQQQTPQRSSTPHGGQTQHQQHSSASPSQAGAGISTAVAVATHSAGASVQPVPIYAQPPPNVQTYSGSGGVYQVVQAPYGSNAQQQHGYGQPPPQQQAPQSHHYMSVNAPPFVPAEMQQQMEQIQPSSSNISHMRGGMRRGRGRSNGTHRREYSTRPPILQEVALQQQQQSLVIEQQQQHQSQHHQQQQHHHHQQQQQQHHQLHHHQQQPPNLPPPSNYATYAGGNGGYPLQYGYYSQPGGPHVQIGYPSAQHATGSPLYASHPGAVHMFVPPYPYQYSPHSGLMYSPQVFQSVEYQQQQSPGVMEPPSPPASVAGGKPADVDPMTVVAVSDGATNNGGGSGSQTPQPMWNSAPVAWHPAMGQHVSVTGAAPGQLIAGPGGEEYIQTMDEQQQQLLHQQAPIDEYGNYALHPLDQPQPPPPQHLLSPIYAKDEHVSYTLVHPNAAAAHHHHQQQQQQHHQQQLHQHQQQHHHQQQHLQHHHHQQQQQLHHQQQQQHADYASLHLSPQPLHEVHQQQHQHQHHQQQQQQQQLAGMHSHIQGHQSHGAYHTPSHAQSHASQPPPPPHHIMMPMPPMVMQHPGQDPNNGGAGMVMGHYVMAGPPPSLTLDQQQHIQQQHMLDGTGVDDDEADDVEAIDQQLGRVAFDNNDLTPLEPLHGDQHGDQLNNNTSLGLLVDHLQTEEMQMMCGGGDVQQLQRIIDPEMSNDADEDQLMIHTGGSESVMSTPPPMVGQHLLASPILFVPVPQALLAQPPMQPQHMHQPPHHSNHQQQPPSVSPVSSTSSSTHSMSTTALPILSAAAVEQPLLAAAAAATVVPTAAPTPTHHNPFSQRSVTSITSSAISTEELDRLVKSTNEKLSLKSEASGRSYNNNNNSVHYHNHQQQHNNNNYNYIKSGNSSGAWTPNHPKKNTANVSVSAVPMQQQTIAPNVLLPTPKLPLIANAPNIRANYDTPHNNNNNNNNNSSNKSSSYMPKSSSASASGADKKPWSTQQQQHHHHHQHQQQHHQQQYNNINSNSVSVSVELQSAPVTKAPVANSAAAVASLSTASTATVTVASTAAPQPPSHEQRSSKQVEVNPRMLCNDAPVSATDIVLLPTAVATTTTAATARASVDSPQTVKVIPESDAKVPAGAGPSATAAVAAMTTAAAGRSLSPHVADKSTTTASAAAASVAASAVTASVAASAVTASIVSRATAAPAVTAVPVPAAAPASNSWASLFNSNKAPTSLLGARADASKRPPFASASAKVPAPFDAKFETAAQPIYPLQGIYGQQNAATAPPTVAASAASSLTIGNAGKASVTSNTGFKIAGSSATPAAAVTNQTAAASTVSAATTSVTTATTTSAAGNSTSSMAPKAMSYSAASAQGLPAPATAASKKTAKTQAAAKQPAATSEEIAAIKLGEFFQNYKVDYTPVSLRPRGLINRSNYCYMNVSLQALVACPPFYNLLRSIPAQYVAALRGKASTPTIDAMIELAREFAPLPAGSRLQPARKSQQGGGYSKKGISGDEALYDLACDPPFEPTTIHRLWNSSRSEHEGRQEDAEEFLSYLLNKINDEMLELKKCSNKPSALANGEQAVNDDDGDEWKLIDNKNKGTVTRSTDFGNSPLSDIFRGIWRSRLQREDVSSADTLQPFFTLQLNIEKAASVREALDNFFGKDQLDGFTCSKTNQTVVAWQQMALEKLPLVLVLHLKWFNYKLDGCTKIVKNVDFPIELKIDSKIVSSKKYSQKHKQYRLFAVVYHDGKDASKGHYIIDSYHSGYAHWLRYDDSTVKPVSEQHVLHPRVNRVPYLLYYRRCDTISSAGSSGGQSSGQSSAGASTGVSTSSGGGGGGGNK